MLLIKLLHQCLSDVKMQQHWSRLRRCLRKVQEDYLTEYEREVLVTFTAEEELDFKKGGWEWFLSETMK